MASVTVAFGALIGWLPAISAAASLVYTLVRLWETETVQNFLGRRRKRV